MKTIRQEKKLDHVSLLKAIAMLFVLIYHFSFMNIDFINNEGFIYYANYYFESLLGTCIPIFFFVNGGLLLNKKEIDIKKHTRKIFKIIFLTFFWGLLTMFFLSFWRKENLSMTDMFLGVFYFKVNWVNHLWFMCALVVLYIFYPLILNSFKNTKRIFYYFATTVFILTIINNFIGELVNFILIKSNNYEKTNYEYINFFSEFNPFKGTYGYAIFYFIIGGILFNYKEKLNTRKNTIISLCLLPISMGFIFIYGVVISKNNNFIWDIVWNGYDNLFTSINVILIYIISLNYKGHIKLKKIIDLISDNTLGIYVIHLIIAPVPVIMRYNFLSGFFGSILFSIVILFISLLITLLLKQNSYTKKLITI